MLPNRQVSRAVADVVEPTVAKGIYQLPRFGLTGKVHDPVGGENSVKYSDLRRDQLGMAPIAGRREIDPASLVLSGPRKINHILVVRKRFIINFSSIGQESLQRSLTAK